MISRKRDCTESYVSFMRDNGQMVWRRVDGSVIQKEFGMVPLENSVQKVVGAVQDNSIRAVPLDPNLTVESDKPCPTEGKGVTIKPDEEDYVLYFDFLHQTLNPASLWSTYSRLNSTHKWRYGEDLKKCAPRLKGMLKNFEDGYEPKQASAFTRLQIQHAMMIPIHSPVWVMKKAIVAIFYCGGLRGNECRSLTIGSAEETGEGFWIRHRQSKTRGAEEWKDFLVPWNLDSIHQCFATRVRNYLVALRDSLVDLKPEDPLFHKATKTGYTRQVVGEKTFAKIPKEIATILHLPHPERYTGHGFRRASATEAADRGATTIDMKRMYGWKVSNHCSMRSCNSLYLIHVSRMKRPLCATSSQLSRIQGRWQTYLLAQYPHREIPSPVQAGSCRCQQH